MDISVFDRLSKTNSNNIIEVFFENLDYLFEYNKDEIIEYLKEEPCRLLKDIREKIYSELCKVVKSVDGKSLFQRRKSVYLAEDIYYLGFSFVHKQAHTKLKDVLRKYNIPSEQINVELKTNVPNEEEAACILETVVALKEQVLELTGEVKDLHKRVQSLENILTEEQIRLFQGNSREEKQSQPTIHRETENPADKSVGVPESTDTTAELNGLLLESTENFHHSQKERKLIRQGKVNVGYIEKKSLTGTAEPVPAQVIKAADPSSKPILIYVGKLSENTREDDLRKHLKKIGVNQPADIINLNCRIAKQSSFCVSVGTEAEEAFIFTPSNWPNGVLVRHYVSRRSTGRNNQQRQRYDAPRFRNNNAYSVRTQSRRNQIRNKDNYSFQQYGDYYANYDDYADYHDEEYYGWR